MLMECMQEPIEVPACGTGQQELRLNSLWRMLDHWWWRRVGGEMACHPDSSYVDPIGGDLLYAGTTEGAAVINTSNGSVVEVWTAGDDTERSRVVKFNDVLYLGFENLGIGR